MADVCTEQIRTVSKARLGERLGSLSKTESADLRTLLAEVNGAA